MSVILQEEVFVEADYDFETDLPTPLSDFDHLITEVVDVNYYWDKETRAAYEKLLRLLKKVSYDS